MSVTAALVAHEVRTQARSLRFRVLAALYVLAGSGPAALVYARRAGRLTVGSASYAAEVMEILPLLTAVVAFLISLDAISRERDEGAWSTVSLTGISSAGYLLRRWLALQAVLLPLTALPVLAAAVAATAGNGLDGLPAGPFLVPWLMHVVPIALGISALGVGLGTIAGGAMSSFLLGAVVLIVVPMLLNAAIGRFGLRLTSPVGWLQVRSLSGSAQRVIRMDGPEQPWGVGFPVEVTGAPWDSWVAADQYLAGSALPLALCAGVLGFAIRHLRRTRPDVRPWRIPPEHPLRTFLAMVSRMRERYTPDPRPSRADLLAMGLILLAAGGFAALLVERGLRFQELGQRRFAAEKSEGPAPTPADVTPRRWRVEGTLGPGRKVSLAVTAEMVNQGREPRSHLAFELNPSLQIEEARSSAGGLRLSRRWDRLAVDLDRPIPPGGSREVRFRLAGAPEETRFSLRAPFYGFHRGFGDHLHARFYRDLEDFSQSNSIPAISASRISLEASDLFPVPRYEPWKLVKDPELNRVTVADETFRPQADVSLDLAVPRDLFLADSCGGTARAGRLTSRCRLPLADLLVAGGPHRPLAVEAGGATVAVFPQHQALGELHLGFLARGAFQLEEAWPGVGGLRRTVALEWPGQDVHQIGALRGAVWREWDWYGSPPVEVRGNLILLREWFLLSSEPIKPDALMAELVAGRLERRRALASRDSYFFHRLFRELALQRLGLGSENGALVAGLRTGMEGTIRVPPPEGPYANSYWNIRFPALVAALRYRMGEEALRSALDDLLSRQGTGALTRDELYALLLEQGGRGEVGRMIQDFFVQGALPEPVLEDVAFRRAGDGWRVTGEMLNRGTGEALCKIVLTTSLGPVETIARAEAGQSGSFSFSTPHRPQAVLLDPDRECHRLAPPTDRVFFEGAS